MHPGGFSPYKQKSQKKRSFKLPSLKIGGGLKKWLIITLGIIFALFLAFYFSLGQLRFFVNHYLRLTFFSKNYVILLQNDYELRPSGGFITAYGTVDTFLGFPSDIRFANSYDIDTDTYVTPPYPHEEMLKNEWYQGYTFRDANWEPNFPDSADTLIDFYQKKFPTKDVDGIIVVNFSVIEDLVESLGKIKLDDTELNKNNLFSYLEFQVNNIDRHSEEALLNRKNVLSQIAPKLIKRMKRHPIKTRRVLEKAIENKDMYFWFKSKGMQKKIVKRGWGNTLEAPDNSDFLAVNFANLGSKKADRYIEKEIHQYINITKEIPEVNTEVVLRFPGFLNTYSDNYKGYVRVMIPKEATISSSPIDSREEVANNMKVIGTQLIMPAGSKTTLSYTYTLPRTFLSPDNYNLKLFKQSGNDAYYSVVIETAQGSLLTSSQFETLENRAIFNGKLVGDKTLSLKIGRDELPPYPIEQVFEDLNTIKIYWSEPIDESSGNNAFNYTVTDLNRISDKTDEVKVVYSEVTDASVSRLELEGVTRQNLERYKIELKGIKDNAGNLIDPDPKIITAVQRFTVKNKTEEATE